MKAFDVPMLVTGGAHRALRCLASAAASYLPRLLCTILTLQVELACYWCAAWLCEAVHWSVAMGHCTTSDGVRSTGERITCACPWLTVSWGCHDGPG